MSFFKTNAHWLALTTTAAVSVAGTLLLFQDIKSFPEALEKLFPRQVTPKKPNPVDLTGLEKAKKLVATPGQWNTDHASLLFVSEPYLMEPDGPKRPKEGSIHRHSKTGQPIPNSWFLQHGLKLRLPTITTEDTDGDGFTNEEEWLAGTDPMDAAAHPLLLTKLSFKSETVTHNRISFLQYLGDVSKINSLKITIRRDDAPKRPQSDVKIGELIPDTEIKLMGFTSRRKDDSGIKDALDGSLVNLVDGKTGAKSDAEIKGRSADFVDKTISFELNYQKEKRPFITKPGQTISLNTQENYIVVDSTPAGATLKDKDGKVIEISRSQAE
ncbi:MAG: hypothetical protein DVB28_002005 [Verrucomicrobia bacterium]|nr:MAG: hypothetical protein DVB28_002005 [Verrucomicrobiota bacterium]